MGNKNQIIRKRNKKVWKIFLLIVALVLLVFITAFLFIYIIQNNPERNPSQTQSGYSQLVSSQPAQQSIPENQVSGQSSEAPIKKEIAEWNLVLVNQDNPMPEDFVPQIVEKDGVQMDERIVQPYTDMYAAAAQAGVVLWISSAYRSPEKQSELFEREIQQNLNAGMSQEAAEKAAELAVQRPRCSEHNTGLALDFNGVTEDFEHDEAYQWLMEHAAEYGFVLRYPSGKEDITKIMYEPWHFRYVGPEHAAKMNELDMCLEEYITYLQENW